MARLSPIRRAARERRAQRQYWALMDLTPAPDLTLEQVEEADRFVAMTDRELRAYYDGPEGKAEIAQYEYDEAHSTPLIHGKLRARMNKKAFALQLAVYRLYVQGLGASAIAKDLQRPVSTVQRALESLDKFFGLPARDTPASESCVGESIYPFNCDVCGGAIFNQCQALEKHRQCADELLHEAA